MREEKRGERRTVPGRRCIQGLKGHENRVDQFERADLVALWRVPESGVGRGRRGNKSDG